MCAPEHSFNQFGSTLVYLHKNTWNKVSKNVTAGKYERAKRAKTRENERLLYSKLKKSKIFQKGLDKAKQV